MPGPAAINILGRPFALNPDATDTPGYNEKRHGGWTYTHCAQIVSAGIMVRSEAEFRAHIRADSVPVVS